MSTFINWSSHPSSEWSKEQLTAALEFGEIIDVPFPAVKPEDNIREVSKLADELLDSFYERFPDTTQVTVMVQGEMTLLYHILKRMERSGYRAIAATTKRDVIVNPDGSETKRFIFCHFRDYFI